MNKTTKHRTKLVGILNLTPDSFSDGGKYQNLKEQIAAFEKLIEEGADIIDIGAESTRPSATPISADEELARLLPFISAISKDYLAKNHSAIKLSLDTRHAENAKIALDNGFNWINDVSGFSNKNMLEVVKNYDCTCVAMHSLTIPADKNITIPQGEDVVNIIKNWAEDLSCLLIKNLIIDPGIGFGKTAAQSWQIIENIGELKKAGFPILVGHSRKSFLASKFGNEFSADEATFEISKLLIEAGVDYLRVHNVALHYELLK